MLGDKAERVKAIVEFLFMIIGLLASGYVIKSGHDSMIAMYAPFLGFLILGFIIGELLARRIDKK